MSKPSSTQLPQHIAIIMDGNGRWAKQKGRSRIKGHEAGAKSVRTIVRECARLGIKRLTLYAFSRENWRRPRIEINFLMRLLKHYLVKERPELMKNKIRFAAIGRITELPQGVQKELSKTIDLTSANTGLILCLALNYGGRTEIIDAVRKIVQDNRLSLNPEEITEETFNQYLYDPSMEDPDLLIRTASEMRLSNFLLWQTSYTELWTTPTLWPDFCEKDLHEAIQAYGERTRKFGGL